MTGGVWAYLLRTRARMTRRAFLAAGLLVVAAASSGGPPPAGPARSGQAAGKLVYGRRGWGSGAW